MRRFLITIVLALALAACGATVEYQRYYDLTQQCVVDHPYLTDRRDYCQSWGQQKANQTATVLAAPGDH